MSELREVRPEPVEAVAVVELVNLYATAVIGSVSKRRAVAIVSALAEMVRDDAEEPVPLGAQAVERRRARRQAMALLRAQLPGLTARLGVSI